MRVDTDQGPALGLMAVSTVRVGDRDLYVVGGERLGKEFLGSLVLPADMRALLYLNLASEFQEPNLIDNNGPAPDADRFRPWSKKLKPIPSSRPKKSAGASIPRTPKFFTRSRSSAARKN